MSALLDYRLRRLRPRDISPKLRLAHWCLRQRYLAGARRILGELEQVAPQDVRVAALARQIEAAEKSSAEEQGGPGGIIEVRSRRQHVFPERIDPALRHEFVHQIEPILLAGCARGGCHGAGGVFTYRLIRPFQNQPPRPAQSRYNLERTIRQIDARSPERSPLLRWAAMPHGRTSNTSPQGESAPLRGGPARQLRRWVFRAAGAEESVGRPSPSDRHGTETVLAQRDDDVARQRSTSNSMHLPRSTDPYDPEEFNRRHHAARRVTRGSRE